MQFMEGLSDRQSAEMVRGRIDWKYALSLELADSGFDASLLCEFRTRLVEGGAEQKVLDRLLERFKAKGWLKARGKQRTDAAHVLAAIRWVSRLVCVGETMRNALNRLAVDAPELLRPHLAPEWAERYGRRLDEGRLPKDKTERETLAAVIGLDGFGSFAAAYAEGTPALVREHPVIEILRQVWVQQYYGRDEPVRWRSSENQHCHVVCNPVYTSFHTRPSKERLVVLDVLRQGRKRIFRLNAEALGYLENLAWSKKAWRSLQSWSAECGERDLEESTFLEQLEASLPQLSQQLRKALIDAAAVAAYHAETDFSVLQALVCNDVPQFNWLSRRMMLCWVHAGRPCKKLIPVVAMHRAQLADFLKRFWDYYHQLWPIPKSPP